jgi:hypothetical protein
MRHCPGQAFRLANHVCHCTDRPTAGGGTAILVRRDIVHHSVPVPGLTHLEATAVQIMLDDIPVKILAAYLSSSRPLIVADLNACCGGGLPVLLAGDLNAKHVGWNSRLSTRRGKLLRDYAGENSCLIFGLDNPTTNPYKPSATPDVLDIVTTRDLSSLEQLTSCSALSSDHLRVLIDTMCRSSFQHPPDRRNFRPSKLIQRVQRFPITERTSGTQLTGSCRASPAIQLLIPTIFVSGERKKSRGARSCKVVVGNHHRVLLY